MAAPPLPPLPPDLRKKDFSNSPPAIPPLPPNFRLNDQDLDYNSPPHFTDPLVAPRPHKLDPSIPANMARTLDEQANNCYPPPDQYLRGGQAAAIRGPSPQPPPVNYRPGFQQPAYHRTSSHPSLPWNQNSSPPNPTQPLQYPRQPPHPSPPQQYQQYPQSPPQQYRPPDAALASLSFTNPPSPPKRANSPPSLLAQLPTISSLVAALPAIQQPTTDPAIKVSWCKDVVFLVDRLQQGPAATDPPSGPARILDPQLLRLSQTAVPLILQISSPNPMPQPIPLYVAEAIYLRATFAASGAYPDHLRQNPRSAFRDFEQAARGGYNVAWFRLGRDYENFSDFAHAKDCFERGAKLSVESCIYRLGMAHLMGQLSLPVSQETALPLLQRAATLASVEVPQPAYVYALLLLSEFTHVSIPTQLFTPYIPPSSSPALEARKHLERAAYLNFAPAQYKIGHAYEFAQPPFPFDPLLSVQYYSLASQQGEIEADMALSKWFLCGADGSFEKDEGLAFTFAEKAARKGLPSAEFAMGYYAEVGVGGSKDIEIARKWYTMASEHGNSDAIDRLAALNQPSPQALSRQEHYAITENQLVRKRTQAQQRSNNAAAGNVPPAPPPAGLPAGLNGRQLIEVIRKNSANPALGINPGPGAGAGAGAGAPPLGAEFGPGGQGQRASIAGLGVPRTSSPAPELPNASPPLRSAPLSGRPYPNQYRYTLTDSGPTAGGPATGLAPGVGPGMRPQSTPSLPAVGIRLSSRPPAGRVPSGPILANEPAAAKPTKTGPATFAEMGIQGAKAEEKDCVIM